MKTKNSPEIRALLSAFVPIDHAPNCLTRKHRGNGIFVGFFNAHLESRSVICRSGTWQLSITSRKQVD